MVQDVQTVPADGKITLTEAAKLTPARVSPNAVWRWCRRGIKARSGAQITLRHIRCGGRVFTTRAWMDMFFSAVADADREYFAASPTPVQVKPRKSMTQRQRQIERAEARCAATGL